MSTDALQFTTFRVGDLYLGVEVEKVQEVLRYQEMTRVPLAPPVVSGLINLRGQIVTALDLRQRLALPPRSSEQRPMNVIIRCDDGAVSLLVDEIGDVLSVSRDLAEPIPDTVRAAGRELISGVYKLNGRLLLILDSDKAIEIAPAPRGTAASGPGTGPGSAKQPGELS